MVFEVDHDLGVLDILVFLCCCSWQYKISRTENHVFHTRQYLLVILLLDALSNFIYHSMSFILLSFFFFTGLVFLADSNDSTSHWPANYPYKTGRFKSEKRENAKQMNLS